MDMCVCVCDMCVCDVMCMCAWCVDVYVMCRCVCDVYVRVWYAFARVVIPPSLTRIHMCIYTHILTYTCVHTGLMRLVRQRACMCRHSSITLDSHCDVSLQKVCACVWYVRVCVICACVMWCIYHVQEPVDSIYSAHMCVCMRHTREQDIHITQDLRKTPHLWAMYTQHLVLCACVVFSMYITHAKHHTHE